jgi:hypothetical protein
MTRVPWHPLTLTVITPMFLGRFDPGSRYAESMPFPVPSLRGVLAYWLRALAGAHVGDDLELLAKAEGAVFGSARSGDSGGPSAIWLRSRKLISVGTYTPRVSNPLDVQYLMGPGLRGDPPPRCLPARSSLPLEVRNTGGTVHADLFLCALWALRTFGGIGARARRGFGTFSLDANFTGDKTLGLEVERFDLDWLRYDSADDLADVLACVGQCLQELGLASGADDSSRPGYPRFGLGGRWYLLDPDIAIPDVANAEAALAWTGVKLREFRLDGDPDNTAGWREIVRPFLDHKPFSAPFRAGALGLPVVYTELPSGDARGRSATVEVVVNDQQSRRASPLWLRVHGGGADWQLRSLAFNAVWLPDGGSRLQIRNNDRNAGQPTRQVTPPTPDDVEQELGRWFSFVSPQDSA